MTAPRPAREQVDTALAAADLDAGGTAVRSVLAAEVRALRAELAQLEADATELHASGRLLGPEQCCEDGCSGACETCPCCCAGWCVNGQGVMPDREEDWADWLAVARVHNPVAARLAKLADGAALVARTPQPAGVTEVKDSSERAYIADAMRHGAGVLTKLGNKTSTSADRYDDARSEPLNRVARHYYRAADVIRDAAAAFASAPPPAVPDGEDVPARLDAAADACANLRETPESRESGTLLRRLASWLRHTEATEVRAAVAAALARPTGDVR